MTENGRAGTQGEPGANSASPAEAAEAAENGQADTLPRCQATCKTGRPCRAAALPGKVLCFFHSPETEALRVEAAKRGGVSRAAMLAPVDLQIGELDWTTTEGLLAIIAASASRMLEGALDPSRQRAISDAATKVLAALHGPVLEDRLAALSALLERLEQEAEGVGGD